LSRKEKENSHNQLYSFVKKEYWDVTDEQVVKKSGKKIAERIKILDKLKATEKKSNEGSCFFAN
jgi:hypothetical protein